MAWLQLTITISGNEAERVSELLETCGASAVTFEDAGAQAFYEPAVGETPMWNATHVRGLFEDSVDIDAIVARVATAITQDSAWKHDVVHIADQAWERVWLERFEPVRFGEGFWIVPSAHEVPAQAQAHLILDPGLAFGTGAHPTTALCLEWLDSQELNNKRVIDFGCGSGILALGALAMGADVAYAVDNDPQALVATTENARQNGLSDRIHVFDPQSVPKDLSAGVLVANILANPLCELSPYLGNLVESGGAIALSGILHAQSQHVIDAYTGQFLLKPATHRAEWCLISGTRR